MKHVITYPVICFCLHFSFGQEFKTEVSESQILIGQTITLTYSVRLSLPDSVYFNPKKDEIEVRTATSSGSLTDDGIKFEITDDFKDTFIVHKKYKEWIGQYVVTAWDSGIYVLPGPAIIINDSTFNFENVSVSCLLIEAIDGIDLYDIKEGYADIPPKPFSFVDFMKTHWWWMAIILISFLIFWIIRKRKNREPEPENKITSLKDRTLIAIEALEAAKLWEKDKLKEHFVELSFIIRSYLTSRYSISLLEKTSYESKLLLTQKGLNDDTIDVVSRILSESDMVKFAKSKPDVIAILRISTLAKQIVAETSPLEFDNVE